MSNLPAGPPMPPPGGPHHHYQGPRRHHPQEYQRYPPQQYYYPYPQQIPPPYPYNPQFVPPYPQQWYPQQYPNQYQVPPPPQAPQHYTPHPHSSPLVVSSHPYRPPPSVRAPSFHSQNLPQQRSPQPPEHQQQLQQQQPQIPLPQVQQQQQQQHQQPLQQHQPLPPPEPSHTPSTHSQAVDSSSTTPVSHPATVEPVAPIVIPPEVLASANADASSQSRKPYLTLPWTSVPEADFPARTPRRRRKRKVVQSAAFEFVARDGEHQPEAEGTIRPEITVEEPTDERTQADAVETEVSTASYEASEVEATSTQPTTPASSGPLSGSVPVPKPATPTSKPPTRPVVPIIPVIPKSANGASSKAQSAEEKIPPPEVTNTVYEKLDDGAKTPTDSKASSPPPPAVKPTSWAALLRSKGTPNSTASTGATAGANANGAPINGVGDLRANSLSDALRIFNVHNISKVAFIEPRGLVNTGNMCYMNSILQTLMFCVPFYEFLDQIGKRHVHSFKSDTPLLEAMIMFMREFGIIDAAEVEQLRMRLKDSELEQYGEAFIPEYVYEAVKRLPRFSTMKRGHQQDAEEFLGFLLEGLHDECVQVIKNTSGAPSSAGTSDIATTPTSELATAVTSPSEGWLEVGPKQKAAVTRSSGSISTESPITKIFGGKFRSELRVPGLKNSVTHEPYKPLQLDIGDPSISNITDALKGLTRSETLHGEFNSPRGPNTAATRQTFIETLPPVLILHLKRFHYGNTGAQKIWKKIGYPLELEIPKEVFPQQMRSKYSLSPTGLPKYRLISVIYHHGKSAAGGHYTVDVRRQEGREWIRFDDTIVRRVRSEDVANEGGEEDPKILAAALEQHKRDQSAGKNIFDQAGFGQDVDADNDADDQVGWSQVNGGSTSPSASAKKWSSLGKDTGTTSPNTAGKQTPKGSASNQTLKDNKVAYILFYQRIDA